MATKKIAVFATGWSEGVLSSFVSGIVDGFKGTDTDIYFFMCYATYYDQVEHRSGELNIFNLPNLEDFDGAVIYGNSLDFGTIFDELNDRCIRANIPTVATGRAGRNLCLVKSDNYTGAYALAEHLVTGHGYKDFFLIEGSPDNMDSNTRKQALLDCLMCHNISFDYNNICTTHWAPDRVELLLNNMHEGGEKMPEVFVCANDILALCCTNTLQRLGYNVPEDVKVTGFDHEAYSQIYDPAISSVDQDMPEMGRACARVLKKAFNGTPLPEEVTVSSKFFPSESCGCKCNRNLDKLRRKSCRDIFENHLVDSSLENQLANIERIIMKGSCYEDLRANLKSIFESNKTYVGSSLHIVLEPSYKKSIFESSKRFRANGYSRTMDAIFSMEDGNITSVNNFECSLLVPQRDETKKNRLFLFLPLHDERSNYGYMIMCDDLSKVSNYNRLSKYVSRFDMILSKYLQSLTLNQLNRKLKELNETDPLTHVKNRNAFEALEEDMNTAISSSVIPRFGVAMFDVNNLKKVNDQLGHDAGDEYIVNCCRMICEYFKHSPIYRIGGDEFMVYLSDSDYENCDFILSALRKKIDTLKDADLPLVQTLSIASGVAFYDAEKDKCFTDVFKRADEAMYANKVLMKKGEEIR